MPDEANWVTPLGCFFSMNWPNRLVKLSSGFSHALNHFKLILKQKNCQLQSIEKEKSCDEVEYLSSII